MIRRLFLTIGLALLTVPGRPALSQEVNSGVISGRITDKGQPAVLADVVAVKAIRTENRLSLTPVIATRTNDLGEYSLFWLPPGKYLVIAMIWDNPGSTGLYTNANGTDADTFVTQRFLPRAVFLRPITSGAGENEGHAPVYYPGTLDPDLARSIEVSAGGRVRGIDIDASAVPTGRVRGRVTGIPAVQGDQRASVDMRPTTWTIYTSPSQRPNASTDAFGDFEMSAVPGRYTLTAFHSNLETFTFVEVRGGDVTNAVVSLSRGLPIAGRVVIERASPVSPDPAFSSLRVTLRPDPLPPGVSLFNAELAVDGSFTLPETRANGELEAGPPEGDFRVLVTPILAPPAQPGATPPSVPLALENLYVKSIRMGGVEVLYDRLHLTSQTPGPLTVVIGSNPGALEGKVLNDRGQPVSGTAVVLVHDNGLRFRVDEKFTSSDASGRFEFRNVPPGAYKVFAWESVERGAWQDSSFMREFESRGVPVQIEEGRKASLDVKAILK